MTKTHMRLSTQLLSEYPKWTISTARGAELLIVAPSLAQAVLTCLAFVCEGDDLMLEAKPNYLASVQPLNVVKADVDSYSVYWCEV